MAKQTKSDRISELEKKVAAYEALMKTHEQNDGKFIDAAEETFLKSPSYMQMKERILTLERMNALSEYIATTTKKNAKRMDATIQRIYEDNKKLTEKQASVEYFVGLTQNQHKAEQYTALQDQITDLKATLEVKDQLLAEKDEEIRRLQALLAEKEAITPKS